ncbi:MAG: hypothetical protein Q4D81_02780 [Eubacteriales bacterium]|nr:hypothetical protein [Eubacteriales bacterium]
MNENINRSTGRRGISWYCPDSAAMSRLSAQRQKFNMFFRTFSSDDWVYGEESETKSAYTFELSPSGVQTRSIQIVIQVYSGERAAIPVSYDALWFLADAAALLPGRAEGDAYSSRLRELLLQLPAWDEKNPRPVCLILSQFEGTESDNGLWRTRSEDVMKSIGWRRVFSGTPNKGTRPVVLAAQIYGGLRFDRLDDAGRPVLRLSSTSKTYSPSGCHIPLLYSLQTRMAGGANDFFADVMEGGMFGMILGCYEEQYSNPSWKPEFLEREKMHKIS